MLDYTAVPAWVLAASLLVWLFALLGAAALLRTVWQFVRRRKG